MEVVWVGGGGSLSVIEYIFYFVCRIVLYDPPDMRATVKVKVSVILPTVKHYIFDASDPDIKIVVLSKQDPNSLT